MGTETDEINRKLQIASRKHYVNREAEREREGRGDVGERKRQDYVIVSTGHFNK